MAGETIQGGLVIMFDGPDGVGKTTQLGLAKQALESRGFNVYQTRVSGGTPIGEALREVSLSSLERPAETDLHIALAMYYALAEDLEKARRAGTICLVDRSPLAMYAYQVGGSGLDAKRGQSACAEILSLLHPELIIVYKAPLETLINRRNERLAGQKADYFEQKPQDYAQAVIDGYNNASEYYSAKTVDANGDIQTIHADTMRLLSHLLPA